VKQAKKQNKKRQNDNEKTKKTNNDNNPGREIIKKRDELQNNSGMTMEKIT
jgi:hypothetical protein